MVKEVLVGFPREAGWNLLKRMEEAKMNITVAYWRYSEDDEDWLFVLSSPSVTTKGSMPVLAGVQKILTEMPESEKDDLSLRDIIVVNPHSMEIENLRARYGVIDEDHRQPFKRSSFYSREPFIYRLQEE